MARQADTPNPVIPPYKSKIPLPAKAAGTIGILSLRSSLYTLMPMMVICREEMLRMCRIPFLLYRSFTSSSSPLLSPSSNALMTAASFWGRMRYSRSRRRHLSRNSPSRTGQCPSSTATIDAFLILPPIPSVS